MDIEFHYYITYLIAVKAGFDVKQAALLAYSSQYVDDNDILFEVSADTNQCYQNYISQTMNILKPKLKLFRIYPIFHFIPGEPLADSTRRKDGKLHYLNTTPDSKNARKILNLALLSGDIYRVGIAAHGYADSWAHQNFVGYYDEFNTIKKNILKRIKPRIGHAGAGHKPDRVGLNWTDYRLVRSLRDIDNNKRFLQAAASMFDVFRKYLQPDCSQERCSKQRDDLIADLSQAISTDLSREERISGYRKLAIADKYGGEQLKDYDMDTWMNEAVSENVRGFRIRSKTKILRFIKNKIAGAFKPIKDTYTWKDEQNYQNTNWYKFQEAVKAHQKEAGDFLYDTVFHKLELENW
jgi:hypothetical protein